MGTLESTVEVSKPLAESLPSEPAWALGVAREVEATMRDEAARFGKALLARPELVEVREVRTRFHLPKREQMVELVFRCDTT